MVSAAGFIRQLQISLNLPPFAFPHFTFPKKGFIFAMCHDQLVQALCHVHGLPHQAVILHALAVIGKGQHVIRHTFHIRKSSGTGLILGNGTVWDYLNHRIPIDDFLLHPERVHIARHRLQVRHGAHHRVSASGSGQASLPDGLLVSESRFSEMDMHITERWQNKRVIEFDNSLFVTFIHIGNIANFKRTVIRQCSVFIQFSASEYCLHVPSLI